MRLSIWQISLLFLASCVFCAGQSTEVKPSNDTGLKQNTPYATGGGNVNLTNGNLNLQIPIVSIPGRNGLNYNLALVYDSKMWTPHPSYASPTDVVYTWTIDQPDSYHIGDFGWHLNTPALTSGPWLSDSAGNHVGNGDYIVTLPDGSKHALGRTGFNNLNDWSSDAEDGSGMSINLNNQSDIVAREKDGTTYHFGLAQIEDTNGNYVQWPFGPDTAGRSLTTVTSNGLLQSISYKDSSGTQRTVTLNYSTITILTTTTTPFAYPKAKKCSKSGNNCTNVYVSQPTNLTKTVLSSVTLPDNTSYTFSYNDYGELAKVVFPTGGYVKYEYTAYQHQETYWNYEMASCADGACGILNITGDFREVSKKRSCSVNVGVGGTCLAEDITVYMPTVGSQYTSNSAMDVYEGVTDTNLPPTSYAERTSEGFTTCSQSDLNFSRYCSPHEAGQTIYNSAGAVLMSKTTSYNTYGNYAFLPTSISTSYNGGPSSTEQLTYDTQTAHVLMPLGVDYSLQTLQNVTIAIDNVTQDTVFDYGQTTTPLRKTVTTYLKTTAYTNLHILNRKLEEQVFDGANNLLADTQYEYDTPLDGIVASSATNHQTGLANPGNISAAKHWRNTDGAWLTTKNRKLDDAGNLLLVEDPSGHQTQFSFTDSWNDGTCVPVSGTAAAYPTLVQSAVGHQTRTTYNSCTGTVSTVQDPNQQVTTWTYDLFSRPLTVTYPDAGYTQYTYTSPTQTMIQKKTTTSVTDPNLWATTQLFYDGIGRIAQVASKNGESSSGWNLTSTCYDARGLTNFSSYPTQVSSVPVASPCSLVGDSIQYDALRRVTQVTHSDGSTVLTDYAKRATRVKDEGKDNSGNRVTRVTQVDALGRLTSVCEKSSASQMGSNNTPIACGQDISETGFLTTYQYDIHDGAGTAWQVTQPGMANRYFVSDSLGQLVKATNPESGTTQYVYNDDGTLWKRIRPKPNQTNGSVLVTTSYTYDPIHRLTQTSYDDGSTPAVNRIYDQSTATTGQTLTNSVGRLTSVNTVSGQSIDVYSYDAMGRVQTNWQCTPSLNCSTSMKQLAYSYDLLGNLTSGSNGFGVTTGFNYNVASRLTSVTSSFVDGNHPGTLMSGASYGPFGLAAASFGNGVSELRGYTPRGFLNSISDAVTLTQAAVPGSGSVTISGSERTIGGSPATSGSGSVTLSGSEQSTQVVNQPATSGVGTVNITGAEQTAQAQTSPGTPGSGSATVSGSVLSGYDDSCPCSVYDSGTVYLTVNGFTASVQYHQGITATYVATALAANLASSAVNASSSGGTISMTAKSNGAGTNYAVSMSVSSDRPDLFPSGSFTLSWANLTGGSDPTYSTVYDAGTVTAMVNGFSKSTSYGQGSTNSGIAAGLASAFNGDGASPVTASFSGAALTLTSKAMGASTNYSLSGSSSTSQGGYFGSPSFGASPTSSALLGGHDATYNTLFDAGTVAITVNGMLKSTSYDQNSTLAGMASALAAAFNNDGTAPVNATTSGATITLTARTTGAGTNYSLASSSSTSQSGYFSNPSYSASASGATLTGGQNSTANNDAGTVSITVNGFAKSAAYGQSSTASSIASALGSAFNGDANSPVTASVSGGQVTLTAKSSGATTNYSLSASSATTQSGFTGTSFPVSTSGANLTGGANSSQTATTPYSVTLTFVPNGNVLTANDNVTGNWTYGYDDFNRLSSSSETGVSYTYQYDRYGNRWQQNGPLSFITTFSSGNNRMDGYSYDAAGNVLNDNAGHSFTYDAENRIIQVGTNVTYVYDGEGRRIRKTISGSSVDFFYDLESHEVAEMNSAGGWNRGEIFAAGRHIATYNNGTTYFTHADWLGTERSRTLMAGAVCQTTSSLPFGDGTSSSGNCMPSPNFFTGKERDSESGNDYFGARYYSSTMGRWVSPDWADKPEPVPYADRSDPQSLNLYGYVGNNPMSRADTDGHETPLVEDPKSIQDFGDRFSKNLETTDRILSHPAVQAIIFVLTFGAGGEGGAAEGTTQGLAKGSGEGVTVKSVGELRGAGEADAHHIIQDAAVKDVPRYNSTAAPGVKLAGPSTEAGTQHYAATAVQRQAGGGTYAAERRIAYKALRKAGFSKKEAREALKAADKHFSQLGVKPETPTRVPGNRPNAQ